ncbi:MAG: serine/threonine-protein kinase [Nocardioides sp.]
MTLPNRLGRLRQVERIGVGGFASVWRYFDEELESDVAIKALADNWAQRLDIRERFLQEARILRRADSDHVVRVYDVGEADGTPYFVMSYADRGTVAELLARKGALPLDQALPLVIQAGAGLTVLHDLGVVHRDIKPANLLLRSNGPSARLMVADLGVAKAMLHASGLTHVVGTPAYMAPEQALGGGIDQRADVYALAAVAYHVLTGHVAHTGSIPDLARASLPPAPSALADLPPAVDEVVLRGLRPDREDRYPDIRSFVAAVSSLAAGDAHTLLVSPPEVVLARETTTVEDRPGLGWAMLTAVCLLVVLATFGVGYAATSLLR